MPGQRVSIVVAGAAARATKRRAAAARLTTRQYRTLMAVLAYTTDYSKLVDRVWLDQLAVFAYGETGEPGEEAQPWMRKKAREDLKVLADKRLICREAPKGRPGGGMSGPAYIVGVYPAPDTSEEVTPKPGSLPDETDRDLGSVPAQKWSRSRTESDPGFGPPTEKSPEKNAAASGDTSSNVTAPAPGPTVPAALTDAARILAEERAARRTDLRNPAGWKHNTALKLARQDHAARASELLAGSPDLTGPELARLLEPSWWGVATTGTRDNAANALVGSRPWSPCGTCGGGRTVPAAADPSRRARCPDCTGRDTPPVTEVELPAEPVAKPEASQPTGPDPWAIVPEAGGDASGERVADGSGPVAARAAYEAGRRSVSSRPVPELRPSGRVTGSLTHTNNES